MSRTVITTARPVPRVRHNRFLAAGLTALVAAGGAAIALPGDDPAAPAKPNAAHETPLIFGDPPVPKGARGGEAGAVTPLVFGDPTVRKGAGGR